MENREIVEKANSKGIQLTDKEVILIMLGEKPKTKQELQKELSKIKKKEVSDKYIDKIINQELKREDLILKDQEKWELDIMGKHKLTGIKIKINTQIEEKYTPKEEKEKAITQTKEYIETIDNKILESLNKGKKYITVDFKELDRIKPEIADNLLEEPTKTIILLEKEVKQRTEGSINTIRIKNLPKTSQLEVHQITTKHKGKLIQIRGTINAVTSPYQIEDNDYIKAVIEEENPINNKADPERLAIQIKNFIGDLEETKKTITPCRKVTLTGIIGSVETGKKKASRPILHVMNIEEIGPKAKIETPTTPEDIQKIQQAIKNKNWVCEHVAPDFELDQIHKEMILYSIIGGNDMNRRGNRTTKGHIHTLIIGDPGTGKSELIKTISNNIQNCGFAESGKASAVGLTGTPIKDELTGQWALVAGAMPRQNNGILLLDELDKTEKTNQNALLEAMSHQTVTITKATINQTLDCNTTIIAVANPDKQQFDKYTEIGEQIEIMKESPALFSRFGQVIILKNNQEDNKKIINKMLGIKKENTQIKLNYELFNKYIKLAKQTETKMPEEIIRRIQELMHKIIENASNTIIYTRLLETIVKLTQASARSQLRQEITLEDFQTAKKIIRKQNEELGLINKETLDS